MATQRGVLKVGSNSKLYSNPPWAPWAAQTPLTMAAVLYVLLFLPLVIASRSLEHRYNVARR